MAALLDYSEALSCALRSALPLARTECVALDAAAGRVLAQPIVADRDLPPFNRAQMDGYALRAVEIGTRTAWKIAGSVHAGEPANMQVPPGQCVAIATGAPLPDDVDTVVQHELSDRGDPVRFTVSTFERGHAVHPRGADAKTGTVLIDTGCVLGAQHLGIAAAVGFAEVQVRAKPRAVVLTSGDEVVDVHDRPEPHQIRNSNWPMVRELLRRMGAEAIRHVHVQDERDATVRAVGNAIEHGDLVLTIGGVSAGDRDHFPAAFEAHRVERSLAGASIQPGRPVCVGRASNRATIVALPGNPVSVLACACLFVWPIVRVLLGLDASLPWREVSLDEHVKPNANRRAFRPAVLVDPDRAAVPRWAGSGDLAHTAATHGLLELPVQAHPVTAGTRLRFLAWP